MMTMSDDALKVEVAPDEAGLSDGKNRSAAQETTTAATDRDGRSPKGARVVLVIADDRSVPGRSRRGGDVVTPYGLEGLTRMACTRRSAY